jgi:hypothetical protein
MRFGEVRANLLKTRTRILGKGTMKPSNHFLRYTQHYAGVAEALPKMKLRWTEAGKQELATELEGFCFALAKVYPALSQDTLVDVIRCMKNPINQAFLKNLTTGPDDKPVPANVNLNNLTDSLTEMKKNKKQVADAEKAKAAALKAKQAPAPAVATA